MRIRTRNNVLTTKSWGGAPVGITYVILDQYGQTMVGGSSSFPPYSIPTSYVNEYIIDEASRDRRDHYCRHRKKLVFINEDLGEYAYVSGSPLGILKWSPQAEPDWVRTCNSINNAIPDWDVSHPSSLPYGWTFDSSSIDETVLKENCIEKARQLKADVLLNLVEGHQLWPSLRSLATCLPELGYHWNRIRKVVKTASGAYLAWKFGVSPVLSDIMAIDRYGKKLADDLTAFREQKPMRFTTVAEVRASLNVPDIERANVNGYHCATTRVNGRCIEAPRIRFVITVRPKIKYETKLFSALSFAFSRFATSPASLAWERIPFSFVADWFVDIRGALRALDNSLGFQPFEVLSFTKSLAYHLETDTNNFYRSPFDGSILSQRWCGSNEYKHYERSPVSINSVGVGFKTRFGKNQAGIAAALIAQKLSGRKS